MSEPRKSHSTRAKYLWTCTKISSIHGSLHLVWTMGSKSEQPSQTEAYSRVFTRCSTLHIFSFDFANLPLPAPIQPWIVGGSGTRTGTSWIPALPLFWLGNDVVMLATLKHKMLPKKTSGSVCQYMCSYGIYRLSKLAVQGSLLERKHLLDLSGFLTLKGRKPCGELELTWIDQNGDELPKMFEKCISMHQFNSFASQHSSGDEDDILIISRLWALRSSLSDMAKASKKCFGSPPALTRNRFISPETRSKWAWNHIKHQTVKNTIRSI